MQGTGESSIAQSHTLVNKDTIDRRERVGERGRRKNKENNYLTVFLRQKSDRDLSGVK